MAPVDDGLDSSPIGIAAGRALWRPWSVRQHSEYEETPVSTRFEVIERYVHWREACSVVRDAYDE
jgi:hypothetical protein